MIVQILVLGGTAVALMESGNGGADKRQIDTVMHETRLFAPPAEFAARARIKSLAEYQAAVGPGCGRSGEVLGRSGSRGAALVQAVYQDRWNGASRLRSGLSAGRRTSSYNCLDLHIVAGHRRPDGDFVGGGAGRPRGD